LTTDPRPPSPGTEPSLTARVVRGVGWVFAGKVVGRGMQLVKLVVLARLLSPEDFGLFGIVMLAIGALGTFTKTGFNTALIQRKDNTEAYLDTAWTVQVIRGLVLAAILFSAASVVGWFFDEPRAVPLLRVMCVSVVLGGFINIGIIYFQKELEFHKQFVYDLVPSVLSLVVGVFLAYRLRSVWALIWAGMAAAGTRCALSYVIHPYRPRARVDGSQAVELFRFGRWLLGSSVVVFLATNVDHAFLGKVLGATALGLYQVAYRLSNAAATEITHLTNTVMMPAYAKVQGDQQRLGRGFLHVFELVLSLALPLTAFIVLAAPHIVLGILGQKWQAAIDPLRILAVAGLLRAIAATGGPVFIGSGDPHMDFWMNLGRTSVIAVSIYPLTKLFGVTGASISVVLGLAATLPVWSRAISITGVTLSQVLRRCPSGLLLAALVVIAVWLSGFAPSYGPQAALLIESGAAAFLCGLGAWLTWWRFQAGPLVQVGRAFSAIRSGYTGGSHRGP